MGDDMGRIFILLFCGGMNQNYNYPRYKNDLTLALEALRKLQGFSLDRTMVLYAAGEVNFPVGADNIVSTAGTRENLQAAISHIAEQAGAADIFLMLATNHGGQTVKGTKNAKLYCWNEDDVPDSEFAKWCSVLKVTTQIYIFGQCRAGGFIDNLESPQRLVITASRWDQNSWATQDLQYDEFLFHFITSISHGTPTLKLCYQYAVQNDRRDEEPQISDPGSLADRDDILLYL